jgi:peptidoglycan hydrolase-like protein with peptidoglycan-binding domain
MKRTLIALFATAALAMPAAAQQQNPSQNTGQDQSASQNQNPGQDQSADQSDPSMSGQHARFGAINLTHAQTRMLQRALNSDGLNAGPVDGVMGPKTRDALKKYQSQNGLNATGQIDRKTLAALLSQKGQSTASSGSHRRTASQKGSHHSSSSQNQGQQGGGQH